MRSVFSATTVGAVLSLLGLAFLLNGCALFSRSEPRPTYANTYQAPRYGEPYRGRVAKNRPVYRPNHQYNPPPVAQRYNHPQYGAPYPNQYRRDPNVRPYSGYTSSLPRDPRTHKVERGETLYQISRIYGVKIEAIQQANHIEDPFWLKTGRVLIIPRS